MIKSWDASNISNNTLSISNFTSLSFGLDDSDEDSLVINRDKNIRHRLRNKRAENPFVKPSESILKTPAPSEKTVDDLGLSVVSLDESNAKREIEKKRKRNRMEVEFLNLTSAVSKLFENVDNKLDENEEDLESPKKRRRLESPKSKERGLESPKSKNEGLESPKKKRRLESPRSKEGGLESPKSKEVGLQSPKSKERGLQSPKSKEGGLQSPKSKEVGLQSPKSKERGLQSPKSKEGDLQSPKSKEVGLQSPKRREQGLQSPRSKEVGLQSPRSKERGLQSPRSKEGGLQSPKSKEVGLQSPRSKERGLQSPRSKERGLQSPRSKERGLQSPRSKERGLQSPRSKERGLQSPKRKEVGLQSPKSKGRGLQSPKSKEVGLQSPRSKERGLQSPRSKERGLQSPRSKERGLQSPKRKEVGLQSPKSKGRGLQSPESKEVGLQSPRSKERGLQSPRSKERGLQSPRSKERGLQSPRSKERGLQSPKRKERGLESPKSKENKSESPKRKEKSLESISVNSIPFEDLNFEDNENSLHIEPNSKLKTFLGQKKRKSVHFDLDDIISKIGKNKNAIVDENQNPTNLEVNKSVTNILVSEADVNTQNTLDSSSSKGSVHITLSPNSIRKQLESPKSGGQSLASQLEGIQSDSLEERKESTATYSKAVDTLPSVRLKHSNRHSLSPKSIEEQLKYQDAESMSPPSSPSSASYNLGSSKLRSSDHLIPKYPETHLKSPKTTHMSLRSSPISTSYHSKSPITSSGDLTSSLKSPEKRLNSPKPTHMSLRSSPAASDYSRSPKSRSSNLSPRKSLEKLFESPKPTSSQKSASYLGSPKSRSGILSPRKSLEKLFESPKPTSSQKSASYLGSPKSRSGILSPRKSLEKLESPKTTHMSLRSSPTSSDYSGSPKSRSSILSPHKSLEKLESPKPTHMSSRSSPKSASYLEPPKSRSSILSPRKSLESPKTTHMSLRSSPKSASNSELPKSKNFHNISSDNQLKLHKSRSNDSLTSEGKDNKSGSRSVLSSPSSTKSSAIDIGTTNARKNLIFSSTSPSKLPETHRSNTSILTNSTQSSDDELELQTFTNKNISTMSLKHVGSSQNISSTTKQNILISTSVLPASPVRNENINISISSNIDGHVTRNSVKRGSHENPEKGSVVLEDKLHRLSEGNLNRQLDTTENSSNTAQKSLKIKSTKSPQILQEGHGNLIEEKSNLSKKTLSSTKQNNLDSEMDENIDNVTDVGSHNPDTFQNDFTPTNVNLSKSKKSFHSQPHQSNTKIFPVSSPFAESSMNIAEKLLNYPTTHSNVGKSFGESSQSSLTVNRNKKRGSINNKGSPKPSTSKSSESKSGQLTLKEFLERLKKDQIPKKPEPDLFQEMIKKPKALIEINEKYKKEKAEKNKGSPKKKKETTQTKTNLPPKMNDSMFQHFLKHKFSKEGSEVLQEIVGEFFKNLAEDLSVVLTSSQDKLINKNHIYLLMKQLKIVSNWDELYALTEDLLPANEWKKIVPIQYAHNKVFPQPPRERRGGGRS
ncbi:UNVERIFIED_CONTAM: hypothetical protein RMT77_017582 [Armadillidium vulgare]